MEQQYKEVTGKKKHDGALKQNRLDSNSWGILYIPVSAGINVSDVSH